MIKRAKSEYNPLGYTIHTCNLQMIHNCNNKPDSIMIKDETDGECIVLDEQAFNELVYMVREYTKWKVLE